MAMQPAMQQMQPAMQPAYLMQLTPEAFQSMQQHGMHPEMMQGMQGMPMQMVMGPMGPMMAAGPMPAGMMPTGAMAAPQLTQMLVDAARGGRSSNVFFKTRICNKWRAGACPYGDKCTYAHGEHELRYVPPEIVSQLEAQQKLQESMQQRPGGTPGSDSQQQQQEEGLGGGGMTPSGGGGGVMGMGIGMGHGGGGGGGGPNGSGGHQSFYKTRLCIKYMQTGFCHKAGSCTFAHGYEDLRQPGAPLSPGRMPQDGMSPGRMAMGGGMPPGMGMMPAGMMAMPPGMAAGGRGMQMGGPGGMPMPMPMPVPMQQQPGRYPGQQQHQQRSPRGGGGGVGGGFGREDAAGAARRRAAAVCQIAGVGDASAGGEARPAAMQAAIVDVRSGAAYRESAYADSVADYMRPQASGGSA